MMSILMAMLCLWSPIHRPGTALSLTLVLRDGLLIRRPLAIPDPGALTGNDSDPDGDQIHVTSITLTSHGTVNYSFQDGSLTYQPSQNFVGTDSFTYQLCDYAGGCANTTVTIRVLVNDLREESGTTSCNKSVGGPVNLTNGNMYLQQTDYQLPGIGPAINITRTYNSNSQDIGLFG